MLVKQTCINFSEENLAPRGKGRSSHLVALRDRVLVARYYYWTEVKRLRFDDSLQKLQDEEFFISEKRIMHVLREQDEYLEELTVWKVTAHELKKQYPSFNWN